MEQLVARWAHNPKAVGSSPAPATQKLWYLCRGFFYVQFFDEFFELKVWSRVNPDSYLYFPSLLEDRPEEHHRKKPIIK